MRRLPYWRSARNVTVVLWFLLPTSCIALGAVPDSQWSVEQLNAAASPLISAWVFDSLVLLLLCVSWPGRGVSALRSKRMAQVVR
ncbi:MAG: hypothetical protein JWM89_1526 [Acidimicrobiales bacterium]|nr:hypothetical protein [Acidimicrobiales bacterium]